MSKQLLKIYFPYKDDNNRFLPIEIDIMNSSDINASIKNIKDNFVMFIAKIFEQNPELEIETDIEKCKFEKLIIEEIDINAY